MTQDQRVGVHEVSNWSFSLMEWSLFVVITSSSHTDGMDISIPHRGGPTVHNEGDAVQNLRALDKQHRCNTASISSSSELKSEARAALD